MKFLFSDSLDYIDPEFDFIQERQGARRRPHENDDFPHEHLDFPPYDGLLISRAIVGDAYKPGKYSEAQCMRFRREGARAFFRFPKTLYPDSLVMGDCGAFSYRNLKEPPYTVDDTLEFYEDGGFTHGCSVDHLIFDFIDDDMPAPEEARRRQAITLKNAEEFFVASRCLGSGFMPIGVIQGWSAASMSEAAKTLCKMGYDYLAVGGMVPLRISQIKSALTAIRAEVPDKARLHLLGFGKTEHLDELRRYGVASFDTTSPLLRAFKDDRRNYFTSGDGSSLHYYKAIRIPQAMDNDKLLRQVKKGRLNQEKLLVLESAALQSVRDYADQRAELTDAVNTVIAYSRYALWDDAEKEMRNEARLESLRKSYTRTLGDRPWEQCPCRICREIGVEVLIFRSSNRNKRRGMHNLQVFYQHLRGSFAMETAI